jgi:hypothetical protein
VSLLHIDGRIVRLSRDNLLALPADRDQMLILKR